MNIVILAKLKLQSMNYISLPDKASHKLRCDAIGFVTVYVFDVTHNEIMETIFSREELHYD